MDKIRKFLQKVIRAEINYGKWSILVISVSLGIIAGAALLAVVVDPHYRYHEPWFYDKVYYEIYATAPSILQREDYDLLMLGTSMTRNFFIADIDQTFGCRSVKLAASGGTMIDLKKFFDVAVAAKGDKLTQVVLPLDIYPLNKTVPHWKEFEYMYRSDHAQDYRYLFSRQTFSSMIYLIKRKTSPKRQRPHQSDRNRMFATEYDGKPYGLAAVMEDAIHNDKVHHTMTPYDPQAHLDNLYNHLLPMFDEHPEIEFIVYLPPYHIYTYCQSEHFGEADALIRQRTMVMKELLKRSNVRLYDFQAAREFVCHHDYFSDVQHFSNVAARRLLECLAKDYRRIRTVDDVEANERELRALIAENMPLYYQHLQEFKGK